MPAGPRGDAPRAPVTEVQPATRAFGTSELPAMKNSEPKSVFILDTSALLAHFRVERGHDEVAEILLAPHNLAVISAISWLEFQVRLQILVPDDAERQETLQLYREVLNRIEPVTEAIANRAMSLRLLASGRLPNADALIAATAVVRAGVLVHCDPHFEQIPPGDLQQLRLA